MVLPIQVTDWNVAEASTKEALYRISAIDPWDVRGIWRIPLGQNRQYTAATIIWWGLF